MRLFERALSRAQLPVNYSEGFNPRARMSLPLPRPVGVATSADMLVVELCEPLNAGDVLARLQQQMPNGLALLDAFELPASRKLHPQWVAYQVPLTTECFEAAKTAIERLLATTEWLVDRRDERGRPRKSIDLRPLLIDAVIESGLLRWTCRVSDSGSARPTEWLAAFGLNPKDHLHQIHRVAVEWQADVPTGTVPDSAEAAVA